LVFSTLHTNDAPSAISRLTDIGVPGYLVASSVIAVLAQRLVRVTCPRCKQPHKYSPEILAEAGITEEMLQGAKFMKGVGCNHCNRSGFRGRIAVYEIMRLTSKVREHIFKNSTTAQIRETAIAEGMSTLYQDGIKKVLEGITTIEEVFRVTKQTEQDQE
jgi:type IV pilus assembly protein PilB